MLSVQGPCSQRELVVATTRDGLAIADGANRLVPMIADGSAPRAALAALGLEQFRIIPSDWRSFLTLASRSVDPAAGSFFAELAAGELDALDELRAFLAACGVDDATARDHRPRPGCQAYPAYMAWLALNAEPADALLAVVANFAAFGKACASVAQALRAHYAFDDDGAAFFDLFGTPQPDDPAVAALQAARDAGRVTGAGPEYGRLLQAYELMFWNTLADVR